MRRRSALAAIVAVAVTLAACGADDDTADDSPAGPTDASSVEEPADTDATEEPAETDPPEGDTGTTIGAEEPAPEPAVAPTGELRVGEALAWMTWDPVQVVRTGYDTAWLGPIYEPLFEVNPDLTLESTLLADWELTSKSLEMTLLEGTLFQDDTPLDAEAVKYNLLRVRDTEGLYQSEFASIADVEVVDPLTVRVVLTEPMPHLPYTLSRDAGLMASPAAAEAGTLATNPVGTGPWTLNLEETQTDAQAVYDAWPGYRDLSQQRIARIIIYPRTFGPEKYSAGDIDISWFPGPVKPAMEAAGATIASEPYSGGQVLTFLDRGPGGVFEDVRVRQAVAAAIDRVTLNEATGGKGVARAVPVTGDDYAASEDLTGIEFDPDLAASLLDEAGVENLSFAMPVYPQNQGLMEALQALLREQGIEVELVTITESLTVECATGNYEACLIPDSSIHPAQMYHLFVRSGTHFNPAGVEADVVSTAVTAALASADSESAEPLWNEWYRAVFEEDVSITYIVRDPNLMAYNAERVEAPNLSFVAPTAIDYRGLALVE